MYDDEEEEENKLLGGEIIRKSCDSESFTVTLLMWNTTWFKILFDFGHFDEAANWIWMNKYAVLTNSKNKKKKVE